MSLLIEAPKAYWDRELKVWMANDSSITGKLNNKDQFPTKSHNQLVPLDIKEVPTDFQHIQSDINTLNLFYLIEYIGQLKNSGINTNE